MERNQTTVLNWFERPPSGYFLQSPCGHEQEGEGNQVFQGAVLIEVNISVPLMMYCVETQISLL